MTHRYFCTIFIIAVLIRYLYSTHLIVATSMTRCKLGPRVMNALLDIQLGELSIRCRRSGYL